MSTVPRRRLSSGLFPSERTMGRRSARLSSSRVPTAGKWYSGRPASRGGWWCGRRSPRCRGRTGGRKRSPRPARRRARRRTPADVPRSASPTGGSPRPSSRKSEGTLFPIHRHPDPQPDRVSRRVEEQRRQDGLPIGEMKGASNFRKVSPDPSTSADTVTDGGAGGGEGGGTYTATGGTGVGGGGGAGAAVRARQRMAVVVVAMAVRVPFRGSRPRSPTDPEARRGEPLATLEATSDPGRPPQPWPVDVLRPVPGASLRARSRPRHGRGRANALHPSRISSRSEISSRAQPPEW